MHRSELGTGKFHPEPDVQDFPAGATRASGKATSGFARPLVRAFFLLFYNTNFLINVKLSLMVLLPLLVAERVVGAGGTEQLLQQVAVAIYLSLLYAVVYVVNDLIDYRKDLDQHTFKVSLLTHTGSRHSATLFGLWLSATLGALTASSPRLGMLFLAYTLLLIAVAAVHSCFPRLKPVTIFIERYGCFLAPPFFICSMMPTVMTNGFLLSIMLVYPVLRDAAYRGYLETKLAWDRAHPSVDPLPVRVLLRSASGSSATLSACIILPYPGTSADSSQRAASCSSPAGGHGLISGPCADCRTLCRTGSCQTIRPIRGPVSRLPANCSSPLP